MMFAKLGVIILVVVVIQYVSCQLFINGTYFFLKKRKS
jgi:hypothetical protein